MQQDDATAELDFNLFCEITKSSEATVNGEKRRIVEGIASLESPDLEGETIAQRGIDFSHLLKSGHINFDHGPARRHSLDDIIGYPLEAKVVRVPGRDVDGLYVKGWLFNDPTNKPKADEIWRHLQAVHKSGGGVPLGWSVEGKAKYRSGKRILESTIHNLAITHQPIHPDTFVNWAELAKSFAVAEKLPASVVTESPDDFLGRLVDLIRKSEGAETGGHNALTIDTVRPLLKEAGDLGRPKKKRRKGKLKTVMSEIYGGNCPHGCHTPEGVWKSAEAMHTCLTEHQDWDPEEAEAIVEIFKSFR